MDLRDDFFLGDLLFFGDLVFREGDLPLEGDRLFFLRLFETPDFFLPREGEEDFFPAVVGFDITASCLDFLSLTGLGLDFLAGDDFPEALCFVTLALVGGLTTV